MLFHKEVTYFDCINFRKNKSLWKDALARSFTLHRDTDLLPALEGFMVPTVRVYIPPFGEQRIRGPLPESGS
jgi:hypothetical protein